MLAIVKHFTGDTTTLQLLCHRNLVSRWEGRGGGREGFHLKFNAGDSKAHLAACSVQTKYSSEPFRDRGAVEVVTPSVLC